MPALFFRPIDKKIQITELSTNKSQIFTKLEFRKLIDDYLQVKRDALFYYHRDEVFQFCRIQNCFTIPSEPKMTNEKRNAIIAELKKEIPRSAMISLYKWMIEIANRFKRFLNSDRSPNEVQNLLAHWGTFSEMEHEFLMKKVYEKSELMCDIIDADEAIKASPFYEYWGANGIKSDSAYYYLNRVFDSLSRGRSDIDKDINRMFMFARFDKLKEIAENW